MSSPLRASRLVLTAPGRPMLLDEPLAPAGEGFVTLRALHTGISRGTERLVFAGSVPPSEYERMRAPHQVGEFTFPVSYGYCFVGEALDGPDAGRIVFALAPHCSHVVLPRGAVTPLPSSLPPRRAVLAANAETALNALWDAGAGPGDRIVIVGAGIVGASVAAIAARLPAAEVTLVDIDPARAALAEALGCAFAVPEDAPGEADIVIHASASEAGLSLGLRLAGFEARLVEMSWYGDKPVSIPLGEAFHSRRLQLVSSQVGAVSPGRRPRFDHARRLSVALALLADPRFEALLGEDVAFADLPQAYSRILIDGAGGLCPVVTYPRP